MAEPKPRSRKLVRIAVAAVVILVLLVLALPTLLSMTGIATSVARNAIASNVNGSAALSKVSLGWFSGQSIEGLKLATPDGRNSVDVSIDVRDGLLSLALSGGKHIEATVSGAVKGTIDGEGRIGLAELAKPSQPGTSTAPPSASGGGPLGTLDATINVDKLSLTLTDEARSRRYALNDLSGRASVDGREGTAEADLRAGTDFLGAEGTLSVKGSLRGLNGAASDPALLGCDLVVEGTNVRVPAGADGAQGGAAFADFSTLLLKVTAPTVGSSVIVTANAEGTLDSATASTLSALLRADHLSDGKGGWQFAPGNVSGSVQAQNLPTSLVQPWLAATNIVLSEDVGPRVDLLRLEIPSGAGERVSLSMKSAKAQVDAGALLDAETKSIASGTLAAIVEASPQTLERLAGVGVREPVRLALNGRSLEWAPPKGDAGPLSEFSGELEVKPLSTIAYLDEAKDIAVALADKGRIAVVRDNLDAPLVLAVQLGAGFGSASEPPTAPTEPNVRFSADVDVDAERLANGKGEVRATFAPSFLRGVTGQQFLDAVPVVVEIHHLDLPFGDGGLTGVAVDADARVEGDHAIYLADLKREIRFGDVSANVEAVDVAKGGTLEASARLDRGLVKLEQRLAGLPKDFADLNDLLPRLSGTVTVSGLDGAALIPWVPTFRGTIEAAEIRNLALNLSNQPASGAAAQRIVAELAGEPIAGRVEAIADASMTRVETLDLKGSLGPNLVAALQSSADTPVRFAQAVPFDVALEAPVSLEYARLKDGQLPQGLALRLAVPEAVIASAPGLAAPLAIRELKTSVGVAPSGKEATIKGGFAAASPTDAEDRIESANYDLAWKEVEGPSLLHGVSGSLALGGVSVSWLEKLLGAAPTRYRLWLGATGTIDVQLSQSGEGERIHVDPKFPRLNGSVDITARGPSVRVVGDKLALRVPAAALTYAAGGGAAAQGSTGARYEIVSDLIAQATKFDVTLPAALGEGGFSLARGTIGIEATTQALSLRRVADAAQGGGAGATLEMPPLNASITAQNLSEALALLVTDTGGGKGATLKVQGNVRSLVDPATGAVSTERAVVDLDANVKSLPTAIVDAVAGTNGTLSRGIGDTIDLTAKATNLSREAGDLSLAATAPFAELKAPAIAVRDRVANVTAQAPVTASFELSPGIKEDILYIINPVFADIELAQRRATFRMDTFAYPMDRDWHKLNGDFALDVGEITLRKGQPLDVALQFLRDREENAQALVEPLKVAIRDGIVRYDNFGLKLGKTASGWKTAMDFRGEIDLTRDPPYAVAITTSVPASQIGNFSSDARNFFSKLGGPDSEISKTLSVGITMFGPLYDAQGNPKKLESKLAFPSIEDIAKGPSKILEQGIKIFDSFKKKGGDPSGSPK